MSIVGTVSVAPETVEIPAWIHDMEFCHISSEGQRVTYCGMRDDDEELPTCADYDGEAICPTCGNPTCPRCAQLAELEEGLA